MFPAGKEFIDPYVSAAVFNTFGLGAGQYVVYVRFFLPGASLSLRGSTVLWVFLLWPDLLFGKWMVIFDALAGPPWRRARDARKSAIWIESCMEAPFTAGGGGAIGRGVYSSPFPRWNVIYRLWGHPPHDGKATLFRRLCQWAMLVEASTALR